MKRLYRFVLPRTFKESRVMFVQMITSRRATRKIKVNNVYLVETYPERIKADRFLHAWFNLNCSFCLDYDALAHAGLFEI
jgi:hypothetical protein